MMSDETFTKVGASMMGTTRDVRNAMQAVHDLPAEEEPVVVGIYCILAGQNLGI